MTDERSAADQQSLNRFWMVIGFAVVATFVAAIAGVVLAIADPADGTTPEAVFELAAAIGGLSAGALFGAAAIYAQVKNLWRFAPKWFRYLSWAILAAFFLTALISNALASS
jgi:hypothetical protein